jgi:hypothetical protein
VVTLFTRKLCGDGAPRPSFCRWLPRSQGDAVPFQRSGQRTACCPRLGERQRRRDVVARGASRVVGATSGEFLRDWALILQVRERLGMMLRVGPQCARQLNGFTDLVQRQLVRRVEGLRSSTLLVAEADLEREAFERAHAPIFVGIDGGG